VSSIRLASLLLCPDRPIRLLIRLQAWATHVLRALRHLSHLECRFNCNVSADTITPFKQKKTGQWLGSTAACTASLHTMHPH
jgi:hypothetical protein